MSDTPREYTPDEVRDELMRTIWAAVSYWEKLPEKQVHTVRERLSGLAFSILATLDGCGAMPAFSVTPVPHESDKDYFQSQGENWYPTNEPDLGMLHDFFYKLDPMIKK
jgi:hypothetical protein